MLPLAKWLQRQGVRFETGCQVTGLTFNQSGGLRAVEHIEYARAGRREVATVGRDGLVFVTLGSMTAGSQIGSMMSPPTAMYQRSAGSWTLWEKIAEGRPEFGRPSVFNGDIERSRWVSFTLTLRSPVFVRLMEQFSGNEAGTGGLVTIKDSNWLLSVVLLHRPHFTNQPVTVNVGWGYGLFPDRPGNFVKKPMLACTGAEVLTELCSHFRFTADLPSILETTTCIPCLMPFITSQFLPRNQGDRPAVVPAGATNFAFLGQYCEVPDDTVFTVEYSVRSAQLAVYSLLKLDRKCCPIYKGQHDPAVLLSALRHLLE